MLCGKYVTAIVLSELVGHIPNQTIIKGTVSDILGHLPAATKIATTTKFNCGDAGMNQETGVQPDIDISEKVVTRKRKNTDDVVNTSSKKRNECTDKNNTNINAEVATTAKSTNHAVDTNAEQIPIQQLVKIFLGESIVRVMIISVTVAQG